MPSTSTLAPGFSVALTDQWIVFDLDADGDVGRALAYARDQAAAAGEPLTAGVERAMRQLFEGWAAQRDGLAFAALFHATDPELGAISASVTMEFSHAARAALDQWLEVGVEGLSFADGREVACTVVLAARDRDAIRTVERQTTPLIDGIAQESGVWSYLVPASDELALVVRCTSLALEFGGALGEMFDELVASLRFAAPRAPATDEIGGDGVGSVTNRRP